MRLSRLSFCLAMLCIMSSCSKIVYETVTDSKDDGNGIRYYTNAPYLLAYSNGAGGIVTKIIYLPEQKMSATPKTFLASTSATLDFTKGVMTGAKTTLDATAFPTAILKAVETATPAILAALNEPAKDRMVPPPYLYKIVVKGDVISFIGGPGDTPINVNILKQTETPKI